MSETCREGIDGDSEENPKDPRKVMGLSCYPSAPFQPQECPLWPQLGGRTVEKAPFTRRMFPKWAGPEREGTELA